MLLRIRPACALASLIVFASWVAIGPATAADELADLKPGTKVIADVDGESVGEVIEKVAPGVYRVRVKIRTGDVIEPALPIQRLRLAQAADTLGGASKPKPAAPAAAGGAVTPGTVTPGTVTPGTVTPGTVTSGTVTPGTVTPGTTTSGTITSGAVQGSVTTTPGTVTPGTVTPGKVTPGTVTQGTTPPVAISVGTVTSGTVTPGTVSAGSVTPGTATSGTATSGTATSGTVIVKPGAVSAGVVRESPLVETPAGKLELQALVGTWNIVAVERNGRLEPQAPKTMTIGPKSITIEKLVFDQVRLDPTSNPRRIEVATSNVAQPIRGIYKRDGDRLRICLLDADDSIRPKDFTTAENDGRIVYECERRK